MQKSCLFETGLSMAVLLSNSVKIAGWSIALFFLFSIPLNSTLDIQLLCKSYLVDF